MGLDRGTPLGAEEQAFRYLGGWRAPPVLGRLDSNVHPYSAFGRVVGQIVGL